MSIAESAFEAEVGALVRGLLGLSADHQGPLARSEVARWDSLKHMEIVFALEDRYDVRFDESEFAGLDSPRAIVAALRKHRAA